MPRKRNNTHTRKADALLARALESGQYPEANGRVRMGDNAYSRRESLLSAAADEWLKGNRRKGQPHYNRDVPNARPGRNRSQHVGTMRAHGRRLPIPGSDL